MALWGLSVTTVAYTCGHKVYQLKYLSVGSRKIISSEMLQKPPRPSEYAKVKEIILQLHVAIMVAHDAASLFTVQTATFYYICTVVSVLVSLRCCYMTAKRSLSDSN